MPVNVPNIGTNLDALMGGINTGSNLFSNIMRPILDREHQKQAEEHFKQQMALRKAAFARSGANSDIQRKILEQQLLGLTHKNDPMYEFNQYKALENMIKNGGKVGGAGQQLPMPTQEMGEGMGMFSPEGLQVAQQSTQSATGSGNGGIDIELLKAHPALRGFAKKHLGYDPLAQPPQTPEEKQQMALDLFGKKEAIKAENKKDKPGEVPLTTAMKTKLQGVVTGVDNSLPVIKELIEGFDKLPTGAEWANPSEYAAYNAKANSIIEPLINAFGLNITDATKDMMHDQVFRKTNEPLAKYRNRLIDLAKEIIRRRNDSFGSINSGTINPKSEFTSDLFENMKNETKIINGKKYTKINGEWHE